MANFILTNDNIFYNKLTGDIKAFDNYGEDLKRFAVIVQGGHCGKGYFIPVILTVTAQTKEIAIEIAKNIGKIKKRQGAILAATEVNKPQFLALEHISARDEYFQLSNTAFLSDLHERRVVIESTAKFVETEYEGKNNKITKDEIRTADQYDDKYVLQRYFAPTYYGDKLVYNNHYNQNQVKQIILDYIEQNTFEIGVKNNDLDLLALYYQIFGENNKYNVDYNEGILSYTDEYGEKIEAIATEKLIPFLESSKAEFEKLKLKKSSEMEPIASVKTLSSKDKFNKRFQKYQNMKSKSNPNM